MSDPQEQDVPEKKTWWRAAVLDFSTDDRMKLIFDHIKNLGICPVVGAAARYKFVHAGEAGQAMQYFEFAIGGALALLAA